MKTSLTFAAIKRVIEEQERGQTTYEVDTIKHGRTRDLIVDRAGTILEAEEDEAEVEKGGKKSEVAVNAAGTRTKT
jgi:hypothetical protein